MVLLDELESVLGTIRRDVVRAEILYATNSECLCPPVSRLDANLLLNEFSRSLLEDDVAALGGVASLSSQSMNELALRVREKRVLQVFLRNHLGSDKIP